jgi:hypothetical protein
MNVGTYLVGQITPLQSQISADVLVDGPCKLIVQLPGDEGKEESRNCHQAGQRYEHRLDIGPELGCNEGIGIEFIGGILDLVELDGGVDENAHVVDDEADDLNGVLQSQGVPHEPQLIQVTKHEDGEIGGDGAGLAVCVLGFLPADTILKFAKDIAARWVLA